jgi:putative glutamine amidotransferase
MRRPIIGITLDWQKEGTYSKRPHFALREHYFESIYAAGGLPMAIPMLAAGIPAYMDSIQGLLIPGGGFASPDSWYVDLHEPAPYEPSPRLDFDMAILRQALAIDMPVLGICAGMQILGGVEGCRMTRNVHKHIETDIDHLDEKPAEEYAHSVAVKPDTLLAKIVRRAEFDVNTAHKEAIVEVPAHVVVNATAPDGVIEGIELPKYRFALGVQWHPEFFITEGDPNMEIIKAFVATAAA